MSFNAPAFLFFFLPVSLVIYYLVDRRYKNWVALASSLVFYGWGQLIYLPLMVLIIGVNYFLGRRIEQARGQSGAGLALGWGIGANLLLLVFFKLAAVQGSAWESFMPGGAAGQAGWLLPLGLSYLTFQVIAYLIDIYNEVHDSEPNFGRFALYVLLFPKIITGPIVRYRDIAGQLAERVLTAEGAASGVRRFIIGLAKKSLIADPIGRIVNPAFDLSTPNFSTGTAWLVLIGYALQLYFDFSGYTDMAIGLGQMLGFRFTENFNYPYIARGITDFWRRWHISLSSWFRDYVFYPLEFSRRRAVFFRQQTHILIVFLLTGLWHGLTLNFAIWGLIHGLALALEMTLFGRWLKKAWRPLQHIYTLAVILLGWVFFRSDTPAYAGQFLARLVGLGPAVTPLAYTQTRPLPIIDHSVWLALAAGIIFSLPVLPALRQQWARWTTRPALLGGAAVVGGDLGLLCLLIGSIAAAVGAGYAASIYGGF